MNQNEESKENQQPIEEIKSGLGSYLKSPLAKWVIALSILAFIVSYLVLRVQYLENSRLTKVQPTPNIDISPRPTRVPLPTLTTAGGKWRNLYEKYCYSENHKTMSTANDLHLIINNPYFINASCQEPGDGFLLNFKNHVKPLKQSGSWENPSNSDEYSVLFEHRDKESSDYLYSIIIKDAQKIYSDPLRKLDVLVQYSWDCRNVEPEPECQEPGVFVNLLGQRRLILPDGDEFWLRLDLSLGSLIDSRGQKVKQIIKNNKNFADLNEDKFEDFFDITKLHTLLQQDFNTPIQNGKSPVQIIEDILSSISIDESYYLK